MSDNFIKSLAELITKLFSAYDKERIMPMGKSLTRLWVVQLINSTALLIGFFFIVIYFGNSIPAIIQTVGFLLLAIEWLFSLKNFNEDYFKELKEILSIVQNMQNQLKK